MSSNLAMPIEADLGPLQRYHQRVTTPLDPKWISSERFAEYLLAAGGDASRATDLYVWNAKISAALFEVIHHVEVLLRNAIVRELESRGTGVMMPGTPWVQESNRIEIVASRIKRSGRPVTSGRIYAGLTFGFWQQLFSTDYEELWRHALRFAFKNLSLSRPTVAAHLESIGQLRNRIAHHGSVLTVDTAIEAKKLLRIAAWVDPAAAAWLAGVESVTALSSLRPVAPVRDVAIIPAADAWNLYSVRKQRAFILPADRSIQIVKYIGFFADGAIQTLIPRVEAHLPAIDWTIKNASRLRKTGDDQDRQVADLISTTIPNGWSAPLYQVFLLSEPASAATVKLSNTIPHLKHGRGSAFARSFRYFDMPSLKSAGNTSDL